MDFWPTKDQSKSDVFTVAVVPPAAPVTISWIGDLSLVASTAGVSRVVESSESSQSQSSSNRSASKSTFNIALLISSFYYYVARHVKHSITTIGTCGPNAFAQTCATSGRHAALLRVCICSVLPPRVSSSCCIGIKHAH